jgi:hypothetical protein
MLVLALATTGFLAVRWVTHPHTFAPYGSGVGGPVEVGEPSHYDIGLVALHEASPGEGDCEGDCEANDHTFAEVTIEDITPRVVLNTADAEIQLSVCTDPNIDAISGDLRSFCSSVTGVRGETVTLAPAKAQVIATITARRAGQVRIRGFDVRYRDGIRRGDQHTGIFLRLRASGAS